MKSPKKIGSLVLALLITLVMATPLISVAADLPIDLGTAQGFAILAGQTITNTGTTTINGNVGIAPGSAFTQGPAIINGLIHINDAVAIQAKQDLIIAYDDAAGRIPETTNQTELGGSTLQPGYYVSLPGTFGITGTLTLDGKGNSNAIFVFEASTTLITATASNVVLINGASASNVFWNIGSSATLGISSHLEGTILAMESITLTTGASINGSLLARDGSVTLDSNTVGAIVGTPVIAINKTANKIEIYNSPEMVTYNYSVSNPGLNDLENIVVTDDKISVINYQSGDTNNDTKLQPTEVWMFTASTMISNTTTNVGKVTAKSNNAVVIATDAHTVTLINAAETTSEQTTYATTEPSTDEGVVYTAEPTTDATTESSTETTTQQSLEVPGSEDTTLETTVETTETVTEIDSPPTSPVEPGGSLPQTATPLMLYISSGAALIMLGVVGLKFIK